MPASAITSTAVGFTSSPGSEPAERTATRPAPSFSTKPGGHLAAAGVVDADEEDLGHRRFTIYIDNSQLN